MEPAISIRIPCRFFASIDEYFHIRPSFRVGLPTTIELRGFHRVHYHDWFYFHRLFFEIVFERLSSYSCISSRQLVPFAIVSFRFNRLDGIDFCEQGLAWARD